MGRRFVRSAQVALRQGTGDKLADIHYYAIDLEASGTPEEVQVGRNLMLILRGKNK
ncbi:hypothetical protein AB4Y72_06190 [Arthrobacter sp. YAF34]|uniref:hypothetical protein n=1 Tax=Arthrobacter sp. YAF34 TaxID=3233083 RepID=UPI003F939A56